MGGRGRGLRKDSKIGEPPGRRRWTDAVSQTALSWAPASVWKENANKEQCSYSLFPMTGYVSDPNYNMESIFGALRWAGERSSVETQTVFDKIPKERREQVFKIDFSKLITREDLKHLSDVESDENDESELSESPEIFNPVWEFLTKKKPACNTINLEKLPTKNDIYSSDEKIAINDDFESFQVLSTKHLDELDKLSKGMQSSEKKRPFTLNLTKASNMINQHLNGSTSATSNISFNSNCFPHQMSRAPSNQEMEQGFIPKKQSEETLSAKFKKIDLCEKSSIVNPSNISSETEKQSKSTNISELFRQPFKFEIEKSSAQSKYLTETSVASQDNPVQERVPERTTSENTNKSVDHKSEQLMKAKERLQLITKQNETLVQQLASQQRLLGVLSTGLVTQNQPRHPIFQQHQMTLPPPQQFYGLQQPHFATPQFPQHGNFRQYPNASAMQNLQHHSSNQTIPMLTDINTQPSHNSLPPPQIMAMMAAAHASGHRLQRSSNTPPMMTGYNPNPAFNMQQYPHNPYFQP